MTDLQASTAVGTEVLFENERLRGASGTVAGHCAGDAADTPARDIGGGSLAPVLR